MIRNFCKHCGARLQPNVEFCHNCGRRLDPEPPAPVSGGTPAENAVSGTAAPIPAQQNAPAMIGGAFAPAETGAGNPAFAAPAMPAAPGTFAGSGEPAAPTAAPAAAAPAAQPEPDAVPTVSAAVPAPAAPALDAAAQNAQQSYRAFDMRKNENPFNFAQVDPSEIFHSFFGDGFPAPTPGAGQNAPVNAAAPVPGAQADMPASAVTPTPGEQIDAPASTAGPAPDAQLNAAADAPAPAPDAPKAKPADIAALSPDLLALTVDVMADRPVIEPISMDRIFEPRHTAQDTAAASGAENTSPAAAPDGSGMAGAAPLPPIPGTPAAPGMANASPMPPVSHTANTPGSTGAAPVPPAPGMPNAAPVPPAPQYAPYMYGQPNAGPVPRYAAPAPQAQPPHPYAPPSWGYGAPVQPDLISTGGYLGMFLISMIPLVGIVYLIIQAGGNRWQPNRRNFARGLLAALAILIGVSWILTLILIIFMSRGGYYYY